MKTYPQTNNCCKSPEQVRAFIQNVEEAYLLGSSRVIGIERREAERMSVTMPVRVTALDDDLQPLNYEYHAITRNISTSGVGLVTTNPVGRSHVQLTFEPYHGELFSIVAEVIHCGDVGYYFQIGCEFVSATELGSTEFNSD